MTGIYARLAALRNDDRGSIVMGMLVVMIGTLLAALLLPIILTQLNASRLDQRRVHELHAAQAGLDVALGQLRAATDVDGNGLLSSLPCGPFTGNVAGAGTERYSVTLDYLAVDPAGQSDAWVTANRMTCLPGSGLFSAPGYALLRSSGTNQTGSFGSVHTRALRATYTMRTTNQNIPGGAIHIYHTGVQLDLCMDANSGAPPAGTTLTMRICLPNASQQTWAYNTNLSIVLVSSKTQAQPLGMCLDAGTPHVVGRVVALQPCSATTKPQQQWSINDVANLEGTSDGVNLDGYCFVVQTPNMSGSVVVLGSGSSCHGGYDNVQTFMPDATVGAGAAGDASGQLVNFSQFGRCLDVTEQNVNYSYLISWPCKQAPDPTKITWNQRWALPTFASGAVSATGQIKTTPSSSTYCLRSPLSTTAGSYVTVTPCSGASAAQTTWTVYRDTGDYQSSYRITDSAGYCLAPTDPAAIPPDLYPNGQKISKMIVSSCSGSTLQKWNAPPTLLATPIKDLIEK